MIYLWRWSSDIFKKSNWHYVTKVCEPLLHNTIKLLTFRGRKKHQDKHVAWQRKSSDSCFFCFPASSLTPYPQANIYLLQIIHLKSSAQKRQGCLPLWLHARHNDLSPNEDQWVPEFVLHQMCHTPILIWFYLVSLHESQIKTELHLEPGKPSKTDGYYSPFSPLKFLV